MTDANVDPLIAELRIAAEGMVGGHKQPLRSQVAVSTAIGLICGFDAERERLLAEIERLTPKPMTLEDVAKVLNENEHSSFTRWTPEPYYAKAGESLFRAENGLWTLREFEARAVAEKYEREKGGA